VGSLVRKVSEMDNLEFYVAREWNGWLSGWQIVQIFSAAQEKFGSDDKNVKKFGTKHIVNDVAGEVSDVRKLGMTDAEVIAVLDDPKNKMIAKTFRL
jgi:hypothetical protein